VYLVQLLLPLYDAAGRRFDRTYYDDVASEMTARFGGLTAYARAPAMGMWQARPGETRRDDVVVFEVMVEALDRQWWAQYRRELEARFAQTELVVRAHEIERL
jgi:hypothetical protein